MRAVKKEFDFKDYTASYGRHLIHQYPAMLHYKLVEQLISEFTPVKRKGRVYDPYCGSGVVIVESLRQNKESFGSDINPLALLIADVRSSNFNIDKLLLYKERLYFEFNFLKSDVPEVKNLEYWFKDYVIRDLGKIREFIKGIDDTKIKKFFLVVFSQTVRNVSNNKSGEFKRFRRKDIEAFNPNVKEVFFRLFDLYIGVLDILPSQEFMLFKQDTRKKINLNDIDLIITSPPYGDSKTTVAYGQFSSFSLDWIRGLNPYGDGDLKIDNEMLGGRKKEFKDLPSESLIEVLNKIKSKDKKRALEVFSFFDDLYVSARNLVRVLNRKGYIIFVVGNRKVKGIEIPMDYIVKDFFESLGMRLKNIYVRVISNKRMPSKNSPTNKVGETSNTMLNEYIVILEKDDLNRQ